MRAKTTIGKLLHVLLTIAAVSAFAEIRLTPADLHPLAYFGGGWGQGHLTDVAPLFDDDNGTIWRSDGFTHWQPTPMLTSPAPFIVTRIEVVAPDVRPERAGGEIEVQLVGFTGFTGALTVPSTLTPLEVWSAPMPAGLQVPISAIRHNGGHWVEMAELRFYGEPVGTYTDVTGAGTLQIQPGAESPAGSLTDGVVVADITDGYHHPSGQPHTLVIDFGPGNRQSVVYVATAPNQYWKVPVFAAGTEGDFDVSVRASNFSGNSIDLWTGLVHGNDAPSHVWNVMEVNDGCPLAMGSAGIGFDNYWGDSAEIAVLASTEAPITCAQMETLVLDAACVALADVTSLQEANAQLDQVVADQFCSHAVTAVEPNDGIVLEASFDGPLGAQSNGAPIAGTSGGLTTAVDGDGGGSNTQLHIAGADTFVAGDPILRAVYSSTPVNSARTTITPASAANSLDVLFDDSGAQWTLNGALDFFFRTDTDIDITNETRIFDVRQTGGMSLIIFGDRGPGGDMVVEFFGPTPNNSWYSDLTTVYGSFGQFNQFLYLANNSGFEVLADTVYHYGITFATDAAGLVTVRAFARAGTGAIDTTVNDDRIGEITFQLSEAVSNLGFNSGDIAFGSLTNNGSPKTEEFDRFRLYDAVPATFEALETPRDVPDCRTDIRAGLLP